MPKHSNHRIWSPIPSDRCTLDPRVALRTGSFIFSKSPRRKHHTNIEPGLFRGDFDISKGRVSCKAVLSSLRDRSHLSLLCAMRRLEMRTISEMIPIVITGLCSQGWSVSIHGIIVNEQSFSSNRRYRNNDIGRKNRNPGEVLIVFVATSPTCRQRTCTENSHLVRKGL